MKILIATLFIGLGAILRIAAQPEAPNRFLGVQKWSGTFKVTTQYSGKAPFGIDTVEWKIADETSGTMQFTKNSASGGPIWQGVFNATSISINDTYTLSDPKCTDVVNARALTSKSVSGVLTMNFNQGEFKLTPGDSYVDASWTATASCGLPLTQGTVQWFPPMILGQIVLPTTGLRLQGSANLPAYFLFLFVTGRQPADAIATLSYDLLPDTPEVELLVSADGYDIWRPQAGADEKSPGNTITFTAKLQNKDGSQPAARVKKFTYELVERSGVPGILMNFPPKSQALSRPDPDLQFDQTTNSTLIVTGNFGQKAESHDGSYLTSPPATITSYDWGGWGALRVTALLDDGRTIVGHLKGDTAQINVRIPKRDLSSAIADQWKADHGMTGKSDSDDSETFPLGDGHPGDGFSLYEEYRGFNHHGQRIEGDPRSKELFIIDLTNAQSAAAELYSRLSNVLVHRETLASEVISTTVGDKTGAVVNFNFYAGSHIADQHGLVIRDTPSRAGQAQTIRRPFGGLSGGPKTVDYIAVPGNLHQFSLAVSTNKESADANGLGEAVVIAHELLHGSNVIHHGQTDYVLNWTNPKPSSDISITATEQGSRMVELFKQDSHGPPNLRGVIEWKVGRVGGQNSGAEECVMRYSDASVYDPDFYKDNVLGIRILVSPAQFPSVRSPMLCASPTGTGRNDASQVRSFGDATIGNCYAQVCINDKYDHPQR